MIYVCSIKHSLDLSLVSRWLLSFLLASSISLVIACPVFADEIISTDTVWTRENGPYSISSGIIIAPGASLTIQQGTDVIVRDNGRILVLGALYIIGSSSEKVIFRDVATTSQRRIDIYVDGSEGGGVLNISDMDLGRPARIYSQGATVFVRNSLFKDLGIYISSSSAKFENIQFDLADDIYLTDSTVDFNQVNIEKGKRFYITESSNFSLGNSILKNTSNLIGSVLVFGGASVEIKNSTIEGYINSGIFADEDSVVSVSGSRIRGGKKGIENIRANVSVTDSSITNNSEYGAIARNAEYPIDVIDNYWGDRLGPIHVETNPDGLGNTVSDYVDYVPWLEYDPFVCCSSVLFMPGFQASRLYTKTNVLGFETENRLWEPNRSADGELLGFTVGGQSLYDVYTKPGDVISELFEPLPGLNIYKSFFSDLNGLKNIGLIFDWMPISYDWRFSVDDIVGERIIQELKYLATHSLTGRVTIVAHSNGGLVTKSLMRKLEDMNAEKLIDKIIFVAVPQIGTPKAIGSLLHGFKEGIPLLFSAVAARKLGQNLPGAYGLLPSKGTVNERPFVVFDSDSLFPWIVANRNIFGGRITTLSGLVDFLKGSDGRFAPNESDLTNPGILNVGLLSRAGMTHSDIDVWMPPVGIRLFEIAGWGLDTVSGIKYSDGVSRKKPVLSYVPLMTTSGDGTVVSSSALAMPAASNIEEYVIDMRSANKGFNKNRSHADILEVPPLRKLLKDFLSQPPDSFAQIIDNQYVFTGSDDREITSLSSADKTIQIIVHSHADTITGESSVGNIINVYDNHGNQTGISTTTGLPENNIIGASYQELGDVTYVSVPSDHPVTVTVSSGSNGSISIDVVAVEDEKITFTDILVSTSTVITIPINNFATSVDPVLEIDDDGDSFIDRITNPDDKKEAVGGSEVAVTEVSHDVGGGRRHKSGSVNNTSNTKINDVLVIQDEPLVEFVAAPALAVRETGGVVTKKETSAIDQTQIQVQTASVFDAVEKLLFIARDHFVSLFFKFCPLGRNPEN